MKTFQTKNKDLQDALLRYCDSRSDTWQLFWGWRGTKKDGSMIFKIPNSVYKMFQEQK